MPLIRHQPFKGLYVVSEALAILCLCVPYWIVSSIPRSNRPRSSWSIGRCLLVYGLRRYFRLNFRVGGVLSVPNHLAIQEGKGVHGVWVSPVPDLVRGYIRERCDKAGVELVKIPAYWYMRKGDKFDVKYKPLKSDKIVYTIHGGGFIGFSAHPADPLASIAHGLLQHCSAIHRIFCIEYRISSWDLKHNSTNPFPSAFVDALAGYNYLINDAGYAPENVIIEGDSSGANLALALTRYLLENQSELPNLPHPGGLVLVSPWSDLGLSHITPGSSALPSPNANADVLTPSKDGPGTAAYSVRAYLGVENLSLAQSDPYISPASLDIPNPGFKNFPRTLIISGDADLQLDMMRTLHERMKEDMGDGINYYEVKDAIHDYLCVEMFEPERTEGLKKIAEWIEA